MDANNSDLDDQGQFIDASIFEVENDNNYKYDGEGRLIQDLAEGIEEIIWRVDGKVKKIIFEDIGVGSKNDLEFDYDAFWHIADRQFPFENWGQFTEGN